MRVILNEQSGELKALYGEVQEPVASYLEHRAEDIEKEEAIAFKIFDKRSSNHRIENYRSETEMDEMLPVGENGAYPSTGYKEGYDKSIVNVTYKNSFAISREMMDDNVLNTLGKNPDKLLRSYYRGRARDMFALIGNALQGNETYVRNGWKFNAQCADGACVFATDHKPKVFGEDQCNVFSDELTEDSLFAAMVRMRNLKDDNGNTLNLCPTGILIPSVASLEKKVYEIIASYQTPGSSNNAINPLMGCLNIYVAPYLNDFIGTQTAPWILIDENFNRNADGAIYQERVELEITSRLGDHDENEWRAYARYGIGVVDFRCMLAGGVSHGKSL